MIDIESRPDMAKILDELNNFNCYYPAEDQVVIAIPQFQNRAEEPWYGIALVCKPHTTYIDTYICYDGPPYGAQAYLDMFDTRKDTLETIISGSIKAAQTCISCNKIYPLNDIFIYHYTGHVCKNCCDNNRE